MTTTGRWTGPAVALALITLALVSELSGLDRAVLDALYDAQSGAWTHGEAWIWNAGLHDGGRAAIKLVAVLLFALILASLRIARLAPLRAPALLVVLSIALGAGTVNLAKKVTNVDCPWSLQRYGGDRPYVHIFSGRPDDLPNGRCFPGGHSSGGFALLALYFVARARRWRRPALYALPGVLVGSLFALTQWLRGAHFPSHDLWSAAVCWLVAWALYEFALADRIAPRVSV